MTDNNNHQAPKDRLITLDLIGVSRHQADQLADLIWHMADAMEINGVVSCDWQRPTIEGGWMAASNNQGEKQ